MQEAKEAVGAWSNIWQHDQKINEYNFYLSLLTNSQKKSETLAQRWFDAAAEAEMPGFQIFAFIRAQMGLTDEDGLHQTEKHAQERKLQELVGRISKAAKVKL